MRAWIIALVLLASSGALAQDVGDMVIPTQDGVAEGTSTYRLSDGTRVLIDWHAGQKHGSYRKVMGTGVVLAEGSYEHGRRSGVWIHRDQSGHTTATGPYLMGLRHGTHERFQIAADGPKLIESTPYILGLRHGRGQIKDAESGLLLEGYFTWGMRHGRFASTEPGTNIERFFVCDEPDVGLLRLRSFARAEQCKLPVSIHLPKPDRKGKGHRPGSKSLRTILCHSQAELRLSVFLGDDLIQCAEPLRPATRAQEFGAFAREFLVADRIVKELRSEFSIADLVSADFTQTIYRRNARASSRGTGHVDVYAGGTAEWRFDSHRQCNLVTGRRDGQSVRNSKALSRFGRALPWVVAFALPEDPILFTYDASLAQSSDGGAAIRLVPGKPQGDLESIELEIGIRSHGQPFVYRSTVRLRGGERIETKFSGMRASVLPRTKSSDVAPHADQIQCARHE